MLDVRNMVSLIYSLQFPPQYHKKLCL